MSSVCCSFATNNSSLRIVDLVIWRSHVHFEPIGLGGLRMQERAVRVLVALVDRFLPESSFPHGDLRRRMRGSFVLALAVMQVGASILFALSEATAGHAQVAALMAVGALMPVWPAWRLRSDGDVDFWSQVFIANMFFLTGLILLASGGRSIGIVMAMPALLLICSLVSSLRQILAWGLVVLLILLIGNVLRALPGPWWINIDPQWARASVGRVPVLLALCLLGMSVLLRWLLDGVFADLGGTRQRELLAIERARFDQRRFADFSDIAADWFWETDAQLRLVFVSPSVTMHTGLQPEQLLGQHPLSVVRARQPDNPRLRDIEAQMARGEPFADELMAWHDESGKVTMFRHAGRPFRGDDGRMLGYRGAVTNVTENWQLTRELKRLARTDPLTGLLNRRAFGTALNQAMAETREHGSSWWLLQLDLDHFKQVNDRSGHAVGDQVLIKVAELLRQSGLPADTLARVGGDEFCALLREPDAEAVTDYADLILAGFARLGADFGQPIGASIGIARLHPDKGDDSFQLRVVDEACYRAKREGRGRLVIA